MCFIGDARRLSEYQARRKEEAELETETELELRYGFDVTLCGFDVTLYGFDVTLCGFDVTLLFCKMLIYTLLQGSPTHYRII